MLSTKREDLIYTMEMDIKDAAKLDYPHEVARLFKKEFAKAGMAKEIKRMDRFGYTMKRTDFDFLFEEPYTQFEISIHSKMEILEDDKTETSGPVAQETEPEEDAEIITYSDTILVNKEELAKAIHTEIISQYWEFWKGNTEACKYYKEKAAAYVFAFKRFCDIDSEINYYGPEHLIEGVKIDGEYYPANIEGWREEFEKAQKKKEEKNGTQ